MLPGDLVGLQQEFGDASMHGVEALTDCTLCVFPSDGLWTLFREHPRLGYDITWLSAHEEGHVDDHLLTAGRRNATERVAMLLMHLYRRMERIGLVEDGSVAFPLNQQHIADALGLSLVHTNKTLRRLSALGLHELKNGRLRMLNTRALARIAEYYDRPPRLLPLLQRRHRQLLLRQPLQPRKARYRPANWRTLRRRSASSPANWAWIWAKCRAPVRKAASPSWTCRATSRA